MNRRMIVFSLWESDNASSPAKTPQGSPCINESNRAGHLRIGSNRGSFDSLPLLSRKLADPVSKESPMSFKLPVTVR
jgi:hypothetical protein